MSLSFLLEHNEGRIMFLDIIVTHVTDSGNNMQSSILACAKNIIQEPHQQISLSASMAEIVSKWLLQLPTQTTMKTRA
jgi:hypothetical protein